MNKRTIPIWEAIDVFFLRAKKTSIIKSKAAILKNVTYGVKEKIPAAVTEGENEAHPFKSARKKKRLARKKAVRLCDWFFHSALRGQMNKTAKAPTTGMY